MGPPASHGVPRAPCYSGTPTVTEGSHICLQDYHLLWSDFPDRSTGAAFVTPCWRPQPQAEAWFGLFRFRSPLLTESRLIYFPTGTEMFQFPALASHGLYIQPWMKGDGCPLPTGFPIRTFRDYRMLDFCPELIAVCHVLHRLSTPRHPPCTLSNLTISITD